MKEICLGQIFYCYDTKETFLVNLHNTQDNLQY